MTGKGEQLPNRKQHSEATEVFSCNDNFVILFTDNIFLNMKMLLGEDFPTCKPTRRLISESSSETDDDSDLDGYCLFRLRICIRKKFTF